MMDFNAVSMMIGKLGTSEVILILVVLILLFGPKYLPKLGQTFGNTIRGFKDGLGVDEDKDDNNDNGKTEA